MAGVYRYKIRFSGIGVEFLLPNTITPPKDMAALLAEDALPSDDCYTLHLITEPLRPAEPELCSHGDAHIYPTKQGWLHIYPALGDQEGCQVACLFCPDGHHHLYYPAARWPYYAQSWCFSHLIMGERLLLRHDAFLLHSSLISIHGKTVLFCAPSGVGKSTQAQLWQEYLGADILNGDRTVVMRRADGFYGGGSIWSGTSGIYRRESAPIAGIILLEQAPFEQLEAVGVQAFKHLLTQTTVNSWDPGFMGQVTELISDLMAQVPIYRLRCRPNRASVELVYNALFGKERFA